MSNNILNIPLHGFHAANGARFVAFGGWNMPVQYSGILDEHKAVRNAAGLFDVSHMGEFQVTGGEAATFLDRLVTNAVADAPVGKAVYSPMCAPDGGVVDDLILYRRGEEDFLVCVNAGNIEKDFGWFVKQAQRWGLDAQVEDQSDDYALLALQGPRALEILRNLGFAEVDEIRRFHHRTSSFSGKRIRLCRTGYTGEDGFEIYLPPSIAESFAKQVLREGRPLGLQLCGLGARDSLRLEAGLPLYGHEISETITPLEAGLQWTVKFKKDNFNGKDALLGQKEKGIPRTVVHFRLDSRRIAREGTPVNDGSGNPVGRVLSGTHSPMTGKPIGSAIIDTAAAEAPLYVDLRGNAIPLEVARPPLHRDRSS